MSTNLGKSVDRRSTMYVQRLQQKLVWTGPGADLNALDYITNLVSRYAFGGNGNDSFGANNLTPQNSPTYTVNGRYGQAADLSGTMHYTGGDVHDIGTGDKAVTGWFKLGALGSAQVIVSKRNADTATNDGWAVFVNSSNKLVVQFCDGSANHITATGATTLTTGIWYFFGAVFDRDGNMTLYLGTESSKGIVIDATIAISTQQTDAGNAVNFAIGRYGAGTANNFTGQIDQIQIFSATVTEANMLLIFERLHSGVFAYCEASGNGFIKDTMYRRDAENTAWNAWMNVSDIRLLDSDGSNKITVKAPSTVGSDYTITLPDAVPAGNKQVMNFTTGGVGVFQTPNGYPINIDKVLGSSVTESTVETVSKTYVLPANDYDAIMIIMGWEVNSLQDDVAETSASINLAIGGTVFAPNDVSFTQQDGTDDFTIGAAGELTWIGAQTSSVTIKAMYFDADASPDTGPSKRCSYLYVFGLRYA
jgi:hypothetical protein